MYGPQGGICPPYGLDLSTSLLSRRTAFILCDLRLLLFLKRIIGTLENNF